jgi:DNA gyrase/topoisomerase IV subunit A
MSRGIIAVSLDEGDELIGARITNGENYIFLGSHEGKAIRFAESQVRAMGRPARGVRAMDLAEGDYLVGAKWSRRRADPLDRRKRLRQAHPLEDYRLTARGGKGVINMKTTEDRQGGGDSFGEGRFRFDDRQPERQDHSHRVGDHPPGGPVDAGRAAGEHGGGRQVAAAS